MNLDGIGGDVDLCQDVNMATSGPEIARRQGTGDGPIAVLVHLGTATTVGGLMLAIVIFLVQSSII